jgi:hypothetical protein
MNRQDNKIISLKLGMTNCYLIRGGADPCRCYWKAVRHLWETWR